MATVKEFRDLGVEFVKGDKCSDDLGVFVHDWYVHGNITGDSFEQCKVIDFAWRPLNTLPDNPKFKYEQDFSQAVIKWRPSLDQSGAKAGESTKPIFTQAMADAGELPPVGSECKFLWTNLTECSGSNQDRTLKVIAYNEDNIIIWGKMNGNKESNLYRLDSLTLKPLDTRTPKQKAIDELSSDLLSTPPHLNSKGLAEELVKMGYRKQ